jgi:hypothetical protein
MSGRRLTPAACSRLGVALALACGLCAPAACQTNHDDFKKSEASGNGGNGGSGGHAGSAGASGGGQSGADAGLDSGADSGPQEPPGPSVLTLMHGVVDAPALDVCFGKVGDGGVVVPFGSPLGGRSLAFGGAVALSAPSGADFATDSLVPLLIAGDLAQVSTLDCAQAVALAEQTEQAFDASHEPADAGIGAAGAGPDSDAGGGAQDAGADGGAAHSALRVRSLPAIPAGTLDGQRSYLLVASGCLGGFGFDAGNAELFCGDGYTPTTPTLFPVLVTISRLTQDGQVGMQVVHASRASRSVTVTIQSARGAALDFQLVGGIREGQVAPKPPSFAHTASDYALDSKVSLSGASQLDETIAQALATGGTAALADGSSYALVLLGPSFDYGSPSALWNGARASIVPSAPTP